jgi:acyl-CoA thioester hydrolase
MHTTNVRVRFVDLDAAGQVNNATYATYAEEARTEYFRDVLDTPLEALTFVVADLHVEFEQSIRDVGVVTVETTVPSLGESSFPMEYTLKFEGEVVATAETTQVVIDPEERSPRPVPEAWRESISTHEGL